MVVVVGRVDGVAVRPSDPVEHAVSSTATTIARDVRAVRMVREGTGVDRGAVLWEPSGGSMLDTFAAGRSYADLHASSIDDLVPGADLDDDLRDRITSLLRTELSPRHVPDVIVPEGATSG